MSSRSKLLMSLLTTVVAVAFVALPNGAEAQGIGNGRNIGIGLGKGTLGSGITGKYYMGQDTALQAHLGYTSSWGWYGCPDGRRGRCDATYGFGLNIDYMVTFNTLAEGSAGRLFLSGGGGGGLSSGGPFNPVLLAANGVLELGWHFSEIPFEVVADWRPALVFGPTRPFLAFFDLGFSVRVFF